MKIIALAPRDDFSDESDTVSSWLYWNKRWKIVAIKWYRNGQTKNQQTQTGSVTK